METEDANPTQTPNKPTTTAGEQQLLVYGSRKHSQYKAGDKGDHAHSTPVNLKSLFTSFSRQIYTIACGGFHTLLLTTTGEVYSFGNNNDHALGRTGNGLEIAKVELDTPVDMISAGESHSVACHSQSAQIFHWGVYHSSSRAEISNAKTPERIGEADFKKKPIQKIISGANHTLVLFDGKVYAWGDAEVGILGRVSTSRRKLEQGLKIEGMGVKGAVDDIFTGAYHAFLKKSEKKKNETYNVVLAWGKNESGELGLGHTRSTHLPTEVEGLRGKNIRNITGGEHHTVVLTEEGEVLTFGINNEGQLGLGKDFEEPVEVEEEKEVETKTPKAKAPPKSNKKSSKKGKSAKKGAEENGEEKPEGEEKKDEEAPKEEIAEEKKEEAPKETTASKSKSNKKAKIEEEKPAQPEVKIVQTPQPLEALKNIERIYSGSNFNYAVSKDNEVYSWGIGNDFVLGTKSEEAVYEPVKVQGELFSGKRVAQIALGSLHVVVLTSDNQNDAQLEEQVSQKTEEPAKTAKKGATTGKKGGNTTGKKGKGKQEEEESEEVKKDLNQEIEEESKEKKKNGPGKRTASDEDHVEPKKAKKTPAATAEAESAENGDKVAEEKTESKEAEGEDKIEEEKAEPAAAAETKIDEEKPQEQESEKVVEKSENELREEALAAANEVYRANPVKTPTAEPIQEEKPAEEEAKPSEEAEAKEGDKIEEEKE